MPIPKRSAAPASYILRRIGGMGLNVVDLDRPIREVSLCRWYKISVRSLALMHKGIRQVCGAGFHCRRGFKCSYRSAPLANRGALPAASRESSHYLVLNRKLTNSLEQDYKRFGIGGHP
jgi:hypothetical protein